MIASGAMRQKSKGGRPSLEPGKTRRIKSVSLRERDEETVAKYLDTHRRVSGTSAVVRIALDRLRASIGL